MAAETNGVHDPHRVRQDDSHRLGGGAGRVLKTDPRAAFPAPDPREAGPERAAFLPRIETPATWYRAGKRCLDVLGVLLLALPALVIVLAAGLLVVCTSRGPMFYTQVRVGRGGRRFTIWKLRSMVHNCEKDSGPRWATALDARITPVGRVLRKYHLDELPQLWNVLAGDMSLVGPRPERPEFLPLLAEAVPDYADRLAAQPGMTGLAQVQLRPDTDIESVQRKLKYDRYYVHYCSLWLDLRILATTAYYLAQVPYDRVPAWLRVPAEKTVEIAAEVEPAEKFATRRHSQDTQVRPETHVVANGRHAAR